MEIGDTTHFQPPGNRTERDTSLLKLIEKHAIRRISQAPLKQRQAVLARLEAIAAEPFERHANVKPLVGLPDHYRLRVGGWRAIYRLDRQSATMTVMMFEPRGSAY